jgi:5'-nucleotidase
MIYFKEKELEYKNSLEDKSVYVLSDFDNTLTSDSSKTSWDVLFENDLVSGELKEKISNISRYYSPMEVDPSMDLAVKNKYMIEWYSKVLNLISEYKISEEVLMHSLDGMMIWREGAKTFLNNMCDRNIPVVIISAGIGNFIEKFIEREGCLFKNIFIESNFLDIQNGVVTGIKGSVLHPLNKNEDSLPTSIKNLIGLRNNIILLGDLVADINMASLERREEALKIGFLDRNVSENLELYKRLFDVVGTNNTSITDISEYVRVLRR